VSNFFLHCNQPESTVENDEKTVLMKDYVETNRMYEQQEISFKKKCFLSVRCVPAARLQLSQSVTLSQCVSAHGGWMMCSVLRVAGCDAQQQRSAFSPPHTKRDIKPLLSALVRYLLLIRECRTCSFLRRINRN
jgi:hypothetical protein